jgi:hypothetical protein
MLLSPKALAYCADVTDSNGCPDLLVKVLAGRISSSLTRNSFEVFQTARKPISEAHNKLETPQYAKTIER